MCDTKAARLLLAYWFVYIELAVAILLNVAGQLLFKRAAMAGADPQSPMHRSYLSPWFIGGAGCLGTSMLLWVLVLKVLPLSLAHPMTGVVFILVPIASHWIWKEPLPRLRILGILVIVMGIALVARTA